MTYKAINGNAPDYISAMFRYVSDVHNRTTRQTCNKDLYIYTIQGQAECL